MWSLKFKERRFDLREIETLFFVNCRIIEPCPCTRLRFRLRLRRIRLHQFFLFLDNHLKSWAENPNWRNGLDQPGSWFGSWVRWLLEDRVKPRACNFSASWNESGSLAGVNIRNIASFRIYTYKNSNFFLTFTTSRQTEPSTSRS